MANFSGQELCILHVEGFNDECQGPIKIDIHGTIEQCLLYVDRTYLYDSIQDLQDEYEENNNEQWSFDYNTVVSMITKWNSDNTAWLWYIKLTVDGIDHILMNTLQTQTVVLTNDKVIQNGQALCNQR